MRHPDRSEEFVRSGRSLVTDPERRQADTALTASQRIREAREVETVEGHELLECVDAHDPKRGVVAFLKEKEDELLEPLGWFMSDSELFSLAADIEDVLLRWHGHAEDAETLRRVVEDLLSAAERQS